MPCLHHAVCRELQVEARSRAGVEEGNQDGKEVSPCFRRDPGRIPWQSSG